MKYLLMLAHPDDEAIASGGTIKRLTNNGDEVEVVLVTDGAGGETKEKGVKNLGVLRRKETEKAAKILGVKNLKILDYKDGQITNEIVWGKLELDLIDQIEEVKPDVVVTFDHSGWYFHLDHVGVSIATLRAVQRSEHKVEAMLFSLFHPPTIKMKYPYVYPQKLAVTHEVDIAKTLKDKIRAVEAHKSQDFMFMSFLEKGKMNKEYFQLALASKKGKKIFDKHEVFRKV